MSWFRRDKTRRQKLPHGGERRTPRAHRGPLAEVRRLPPDHLEEGPGGQLERLPQVRLRTSASTPLTRLKLLLDDGEYETFDAGLRSSDPLGFVDSKPYSERLAAMQQATELSRRADRRRRQARRPPGPDLRHGADASSAAAWAAVVGEKITRAIERAIAQRARRWSSSPLPAARACRKAPSA